MTKTQEPLPTFEDEQVQSVQVRITNAGDGLSEALKISPKVFHLGDEFSCVLRGTVSQINHKQGDDEVIVRVHTVKASAITEVDADMAKRILTAAADNLARAKAERDGQLMLEADEDLEAREEVAALHERQEAAEIDEVASDEVPKDATDDDGDAEVAEEDLPTPIFSNGLKGLKKP